MSTDHPDAAVGAPVGNLAPSLADYIQELQLILQTHGNLPVEKWLPARGRHGAPTPQIAYRRNYPRGQQKTPAFWNQHDTEAQRGEPVVRI